MLCPGTFGLSPLSLINISAFPLLYSQWSELDQVLRKFISKGNKWGWLYLETGPFLGIIKMVLIQWLVSFSKGEGMHRCMHRERSHVRTEAEFEAIHPQAKQHKERWQPSKWGESFSVSPIRASVAQSVPWVYTCVLQNGNNDFQSCELPIIRSLLWQLQGAWPFSHGLHFLFLLLYWD